MAHRPSLNLEARRRLQLYSNSLFMSMPEPPVHKMFSFSVFTLYYSEDVMYSKAQLENQNVDGITILYYLQTIVRDEWKNFLERMLPDVEYNQLGHYTENEVSDILQLCLWTSYRGQTLARTGLCAETKSGD